MPNRERRKAQQLLNSAQRGVIDHGHQGLYDVTDRLRVWAARLDGAKRREVLFKCNEICQALDANMEVFVTGVRDPSVPDRAAINEGVYNLLRDCQPIYHALRSKGSLTEACDEFDAAQAALERAKEADLERVADHFATVKGKIMKDKARRDPPSICPLCRRLVPRRSFRALPPSRAS